LGSRSTSSKESPCSGNTLDIIKGLQKGKVFIYT